MNNDYFDGLVKKEEYPQHPKELAEDIAQNSATRNIANAGTHKAANKIVMAGYVKKAAKPPLSSPAKPDIFVINKNIGSVNKPRFKS